MDRYTISFDMENRTKNQEYFILEELEEVLKTHLSLKYASKVEHLLPPRERAEKYFDELEKKIKNDYGDKFEKYKKMCIIKRPRFGVMERGWVSLIFTVHEGEGGAATHYSFYPEHEHWLVSYGVKNFKELDGKPVWCIVQGVGGMMFPFKPIKI